MPSTTWRVAAGIISRDEHALITRRGELRDKVIRVDDFPYDFGLRQALDGLADEQRKAA
jgi:acyl-CoA dehydrogenase